MFTGKFDYQMDDRKRVPIPPMFRKQFESAVYQAMGTAPCIVLYTEEALLKTAEIIEAIPAETEAGDNARRDFYSNVHPALKDGQGRVTLRDDLIEYAGLGRDVLVVGIGTKLEIWDRAAFLARGPEQREQPIEATAELAKHRQKVEA